MAEPTAVPGVDPSRVNTPDGLAACLDGLRRRRGLSYEAMEKAATKLLSQSGGSRLVPLSKSTVGEIVTGKRLPAKGKLRTFLAVCEVAPADYAQWVAAWERARTADLARPADAVRVRDARPRLLGVHAAIQVEEKVPGELPVYVPRDIDDRLRAVLAADAQRGCFMLLVGGSSVGKTRTLYEAVKTVLPDWWLVHPAGPGEVAALAAARTPRTVVWLDELQRYLDGEQGLTGGTVRALLGAPHPAVLIGTLWPDRFIAYTTVAEPGHPDPYAREREVLDLAAVVRIGPDFSEAEQGRTRATAARDPRLRVALESPGYGLTQTLAAAPQLVARWEDAQTASPYAWAVLTAALDAARLGARTPLSTDFLRAAAPGYCTSQQQAEAPGNWFEQALAYVTGKLHGAAATLAPAGAGMGQVDGYTVADYLLQHATQERRATRVPASIWDAFISHVRDPADVGRLAGSAQGRLLYRYAIPLYRHAADGGDGAAARALAGLLAKRGDLDRAEHILRGRADAGDQDAAVRLAELLYKHGDLDGLRARADTGDRYAAMQLAELLIACGDLDGAEHVLRGRADAGDQHAAKTLAELLTACGDLEGAAQILLPLVADSRDRYAAMQLAELADLLAGRGDLDGAAQILRAAADVGDVYAAKALAELLYKHGDLDGLRARADSGDKYAAMQLAELLAERGDLDGAEQILRARTGWDTAGMLAGLLAERGDLDGAEQILRARVGTDNGAAARALAGLLAERGDLDRAEHVLRTAVDAGDAYAAMRLAGLLAERGDQDGAAQFLDRATQMLRARADAGDENAAGRLAELLAERGDLDGLRARANAGEAYAAGVLAKLLADRGDLEELRARANVGDLFAAGMLADVLIKQGRGEEAERLRRFGLDPDGSIACT